MRKAILVIAVCSTVCSLFLLAVRPGYGGSDHQASMNGAALAVVGVGAAMMLLRPRRRVEATETARQD